MFDQDSLIEDVEACFFVSRGQVADFTQVLRLVRVQYLHYFGALGDCLVQASASMPGLAIGQLQGGGMHYQIVAVFFLNVRHRGSTDAHMADMHAVRRV